MDAPTPEALTLDDVDLLTRTAEALDDTGSRGVAEALRDIARRIAASLEAAS